MISYSPEQQEFFRVLTEEQHSILLEAVAGSGKTFTIVEGSRLLPPGVLSIFLAFNKNIATELEERLPFTVQCGTFHSYCLKALSRAMPTRPKIDKDKIHNLLKKNLSWKEFEAYGAFAKKLISYMKSSGAGVLEPDLLEASSSLISHFALTLESRDADPEEAQRISISCFEASLSITDVIDFDDMLFLALAKKVRFDLASFVFVDEAQDTNSVQRELLKQMLAPTGRLIVVGDPKQAIYGFRGADASAMDELQKTFNMKKLSLSTCYRCSTAVIAEVQKVCFK